MEHLELQLSSIASTVNDTHDVIQQRVDKHKQAALEQLEATGGRQALESHLKAQKAQWKFIGQKEAFLDCLRTMDTCNDLLRYDFSSDIAIAERAVQALKEEIRDRHAAILQMEQAAQDMVTQLAQLHAKSKTTATDLARQLPIMAAELHDRKARRQQPPEPIMDGASEAELLRLVEQEEKLAAEVEEAAAKLEAHRAAEAAQRGMLEDALRGLKADLAAAEEQCSTAAERAGARYKAELQRLGMLNKLLSRINGVEVSEHEECALHLTISQAIPRGMPRWSQQSALADAAQSSGAPSTSGSQPMDIDGDSACGSTETMEHMLSLAFDSPECVTLRSATLTPPEVDISSYIKAVQSGQDGPGKDAAGALYGLVLWVKAQLRRHWRRQLQLEDAHEVYPLQPTSVSPQVLRCVLPNKVEVEVQVPLSWPEDPHARLKLMQLEAPRTSQDLGALLARLQRELEEANGDHCGPSESGGTQAELRRRRLRGCSLRDLLGWVYSSVAGELGA